MLREHTTRLRVRYDETDPMGVVHHSNYLKYFEIGRTELLRASGGRYRDVEAIGFLIVVVHVDCRYRRPAKYDDVLFVHTRIDRVTAGKIIHQYEITLGDGEKDTGQVLVDATVTLAVVNRAGELQRVPEELRLELGE
ncbi:MAG: thioesterase family protein [Planctomycetota bacterium]